jgi:hypothetical protein
MGDSEIVDTEAGGDLIVDDAVGNRHQHAEEDYPGFIHGHSIGLHPSSASIKFVL